MIKTPDSMTPGMVALLGALSGLAALIVGGVLASLYAAGWAWWEKRRVRRNKERTARWLRANPLPDDDAWPMTDKAGGSDYWYLGGGVDASDGRD